MSEHEPSCIIYICTCGDRKFGLFVKLIEDQKKYMKEMRGKVVSSIIYDENDNLIISFTDGNIYHITSERRGSLNVSKAITKEEKTW